mmetsp:Transcript_64661/g.127850  ORF Transcript_64661/g.127850 Transcript_64661/m.127850 type:complete len:637 (-) Transcript_64661:262-2172(-)
MFGEAVDFAPVARTSGRRRAPLVLPVVQGATPQPQLTPKEQANKLAGQVGIDPALLDGIPKDLLSAASATDLRLGMRFAVTALQQGKPAGDGSGNNTSIGEFLRDKIALLPLVTRFPLMAEWTDRPGQGLPVFVQKRQQSSDPKKDSKKKLANALPSSAAANFISFDALPGASGQQHETRVGWSESVHHDVDREMRFKKTKEKEKKKKQVGVVADAEEDGDWHMAVETSSVQPVQPGRVVAFQPSVSASSAKAAKSFLEGIHVDRGASEEDAAMKREEAKKAASKIVMSLSQTKAAVEAGYLAQRRSMQLLAPHTSQEEQDGALGNDEMNRSGRGGSIVEQHILASEQHDVASTGNKGEERSFGRSRSHNRGGRHDVVFHERRHADDDGAHDGSDLSSERQRRRPRHLKNQKSRSCSSRSFHSQRLRPRQGQRRSRSADSRSCSREMGDGYACRAKRPREGYTRNDPEDSSRRRRKPDVAAQDRSQSRDRLALYNEDQARRHEASRSSSMRAQPGFSSSTQLDKRAAFEDPPHHASASKLSNFSATSTPGRVPSRPAPVLRQLACRNGWAEYVDQSNGEHVYKNVMTGEMTRKKPPEYGNLISDSMNQRRLSWLQSQRNQAQIEDLRMRSFLQPNT